MSESEDRVSVDTGPGEALERLLVPTLFGPWALEVVEHAGLKPGERVLDVACGTGPAARHAAERVLPSGHVTGFDLDAGLLEVAKRRADEEELTIAWRQGDVQQMPFESNEFDVVLCCQGLQFFPDKHGALQEIRRVLRADGRLAASTWRDVQFCPGHDAVAKAIVEAAGTTPSPMPPFSLASADEVAALADEAGFLDVEVSAVRKLAAFTSVRDFVDALAAGAPSTRHALAALDQSAKQAVIASVTKALAMHTSENGLNLPMESHVLTARASV